MVEEKIFGPWGCFRDLVVGALRISEVEGNRWINAYKNYSILKAAGATLPKTEFQIRPLTSLKKDELKIKAWKRASRFKSGITGRSCLRCQRRRRRL
jgi:hypothetical protein